MQRVLLSSNDSATRQTSSHSSYYQQLVRQECAHIRETVKVYRVPNAEAREQDAQRSREMFRLINSDIEYLEEYTAQVVDYTKDVMVVADALPWIMAAVDKSTDEGYKRSVLSCLQRIYTARSSDNVFVREQFYKAIHLISCKLA